MDTPWLQPLLDSIAQGTDPKTVIPDEFVVVRGGLRPLPPTGMVFSGAIGKTLDEAGAGVPHNKVRLTTVGEIRVRGGTVELAPEPTASGEINNLHVNIIEGGSTSFSEPTENPVPKAQRLK